MLKALFAFALLCFAQTVVAAEIKLQPLSFAGTVASYPDNIYEASSMRFEARVFAILVNGRQLSLPLPSTKDGPKAIRFVVCIYQCTPLPSTYNDMQVANLIVANVGDDAIYTLSGNVCELNFTKLDNSFYSCIAPDLNQQVFRRMH